MPNSFLQSLQKTWIDAGESPLPYPAPDNTQAWQFAEHKMVIQLIPVREYLNSWDLNTLSDYARSIESGYHSVHIWEDIWRRHPEAVEGRVKALLGNSHRIYGRDTEVRRIAQPVLQEFLDLHHTNVSISAKYKYGLFYKEYLVAVAAFGAMRKLEFEGGAQSSELVRFCNATDSTVVGGLSKLLKAFYRDRPVEHLMTYADREWSAGRGYEKLGFRRKGERTPQKFWVDPRTWERHYPHRVEEDAPKPWWLPAFNLGSWKYVYWIDD